MLMTFSELSSYDSRMSKTAAVDVERYSATHGERATAELLLESQEQEAKKISHFDVFLSHSYEDVKLNKKRILQIKYWLENRHNLAVYVDWINDPLLSRSSVTPATAAKLRERMRQSDSLFFATSESSNNSRWMPWELGYKDAHRNRHGYDGRCAILPISEERTVTYLGAEYLGLHPFVEEVSAALTLSPQPKTAMSASVSYKPWVTTGRNPS